MATALLGIDGRTDLGLLASDGCCPPKICNISLCAVVCNFINSLPRGPLWDRAKAEALSQANTNPCLDGFCPPPVCHSIVAHAVYTGNRLWNLLQDALWPSIRESDPFTCFDTVDDWLKRLGWIDCFNSACRNKNLGYLTPLEILCAGAPTYAPPTFSADLTLAVKLGIVQALTRLDMGIVPTTEQVNFVIAPLGAKVSAVGLSCEPWPCSEGCEPPDGGCIDAGPDVLGVQCFDGIPDCPTYEPDTDCATAVVGVDPRTVVLDIDPADPCCRRCDHPVWQICRTGTTLPRPVKTRCDIDNVDGPNVETIPAYWSKNLCTDPAGQAETIWPGVLAAECIVRSLIPPGFYLEIQRCC